MKNTMRSQLLVMLLSLPVIGSSQTIITYDRSDWQVVASSQELVGDAPNGPVAKVLDGDNNTFWASRWTQSVAPYPHVLIVDMQQAQPVNQIYYVPRNDWNSSPYIGTLSFGDNGVDFGPEMTVNFSFDFAEQVINLPTPAYHRYFRLTITQNRLDHANGNHAFRATCMAEIGARYSTTLAATLSAFTVLSQETGVELNWSTTMEENSVGWYVTRSSDARGFIPIGYIPATGGPNESRDYSFTDSAPLTGINFYRLELQNVTWRDTSRILNTQFPVVEYSSAGPKSLNIFYFIPSDQAAPPDFKARLDTILLSFQTYVGNEMERNGRGYKTFSLATDPTHGMVDIKVVNAKHPHTAYPYSGGAQAVAQECADYMAAHPSPYSGSHNLFIIPAQSYNPITGAMSVDNPFYGIGRNCYAIDYADMKQSYLGTTGFQGNLATQWIGGMWHEIGHGLNLPHNHLKSSEVAGLGTSLMSYGNSTLGHSTTSLTAADCAILNRNELFNDAGMTYYGPSNASIANVYACYSVSRNAIVVAGRIATSSVPVTDVVIYNDPDGGADYNAVTWQTEVIGADSFYVEMPVTDLFITGSSPYQIRIMLIQADGKAPRYPYQYLFTNGLPVMTDLAFRPITATISASAGGNGSISPNGATTISCAADQPYSFEPEAGFMVEDVIVDGVSQGPLESYVFTNVNHDHVISVSFTVLGNVPSNDAVCSALPLSVGTNGPFTNVNARVQPGEAAPPTGDCGDQINWCSPPDQTVWFSFIAPPSGRVSVNFGATQTWDSQIALWSAPSCVALLTGGATLVAANDDFPGAPAFSAAIAPVCVTYGETYFIQVDGYTSTTDAAFELVLVEEPGIGSTCDDGDPGTVNDMIQESCICQGEVLPSTAMIRVILEGPYDPATGLMRDDLRSAGWIPSTEPYTALGYNFVDGEGGDVLEPSLLGVTGVTALVDWVVIELRNNADPSTIVASKAGLVRRDGSIITPFGGSVFSFLVPRVPYHVAIRHRNHLGSMTANPVVLGGPLNPTVVDLASGATLTFGGSAARKSVAGAFPAEVHWAGDVTFDGTLKYTGSSNDRDPILGAIGGIIPTTTITGYHSGDVNMDGTVKYTGSLNDRDIILQNIGGVVPTNTRVEQLP